MNLLGVTPGLVVADIGAGSGYYTVRLARRVGPTGHVFAEDVIPEYLERLARRIAGEGLAGMSPLFAASRTIHGCRPARLDLALLVHMYHEVQQPYGLLMEPAPGVPSRRLCRGDRCPQTNRSARHPA